MRYAECRDRIQAHLQEQPDGVTWTDLRDALNLPYERACPEWTKRLEREIGLTRSKGIDRALIWRIKSAD